MRWTEWAIEIANNLKLAPIDRSELEIQWSNHKDFDGKNVVDEWVLSRFYDIRGYF
jgi:hypothetical protein